MVGCTSILSCKHDNFLKVSSSITKLMGHNETINDLHTHFINIHGNCLSKRCGQKERGAQGLRRSELLIEVLNTGSTGTFRSEPGERERETDIIQNSCC